jgi:hypothetical protein
MPKTEAPRAAFSVDGTTAGGTTGGTSTPSETLATFDGETRNFIEMNGTRTFDVQTVPLSTADAFTVWGQTVQTNIKELPTDTKVCLFAEFKNANPSNILVLSAVRRRLVLGTQVTSTGVVSKVSYSWLVFPGDTQRNQTNCLTTGIIAAKNSIFGTTASMKFSLPEVCSNCTSSIQSEGLKVHFDSGAALSAVNLSGLKLKIQLSASDTTTGQTCSSNSACTQQGFNCCLEGQCVNDGAVKNGVDTAASGFLAAWEDVQNNPMRFTIYPQFFYVCPTTVPTVPGDDDATDPEFASRKRLNEMKDLFDCINPQFDEIGYCSKKIANASALIASPATQTFTVPMDDNNFRWANSLLNTNSIYSFRYGEQLLYQEGLTGFNSVQLTGSHDLAPPGSDDLDEAQSVKVTKILPSNALDDTLIIKYKVDATCVKLSGVLARCTKSYVQGRISTTPRPSDHPTSNSFQLPKYADLTNFPPLVKVGGVVTTTNWTADDASKRIIFSVAPTTNQSVEITYYVTPSTADLTTLTEGRTAAQTRVNELCGCGVIGTTNCNLTPVSQTTNGVTSVTDYSCVYPAPPTPEPPLQQVVFVSGKTVPYRYHDVNGAVWDNDTGASAPAQEGIAFAYTNGDKLKPNNLSSYVGFNEIYGSFDKTAAAAKPPRMVAVKKGTNYDIFVDSGAFASCENCGNDPYAPILKLFPTTFATRGGGYVPDLSNSVRSNVASTYRADDLLFGRACFVPATMLPWSHVENSDIKTQRRRRLAAQHLMFANGYQRDWFGFDYGSLIGSFDGVNWFSIGNQRRIKASSSKLLLAVNGYFADQTIDNNFKVVVSETVAAVNSGSNVTHDTMSDGAECQKNHFCSNDNDCIAQLGYDYTCQNVTGLRTPWMSFDPAGNEQTSSEEINLISLLGGVNGQARRCVYRGRGAPCAADLNNIASTFNGENNSAGLAACSPNHYCARVDGPARFNTAIARFASSPSSQNLLAGLGTKDVFGLGARYIGRPLNYYGDKSVSSVNAAAWGFSTSYNLSQHLKDELKVDGLCLPGRDIAGSSTYADAHSRIPSSGDKEAADRIFGVGPSAKVDATTTTNSKLLMMCPVVLDGTFAHHTPGTSLTNAVVAAEANRQNIPTTLLNMTDYAGLNLFNTNAGSAATTIGYQRYACLRAPGASCFSDMECAPSATIATKMKSLASFGNFATNVAEQAFWKEELTCGNPEPYKTFGEILNPSFDVKDNRCCRESGKTLQTFTQTQTEAASPFLNCASGEVPLAGFNQAVNSAKRNPRSNVVADIATCSLADLGDKTHALWAIVNRGAGEAQTAERQSRQYETLDTMNQRMCCTGNWVRSFASENGGGHKWGQGRTQNVDMDIFGAWNWQPDESLLPGVLESGEDERMACSADNFGTPACEIRNLTDAQSTAYLNWIAQFELVGIPQVGITVPTTANGLARIVEDNPALPNLSQQVAAGADQPLRKTLLSAVPDFDTTGNFISAASYSKIDIGSGKMKKVFSESEFNCCVPAGGSVPANADANMCCTGTLTTEAVGSEGEARCCLEDFSDVTLYLNRYVSSEGNGLPASMYDPMTGYIKDPAQVFAIAQAKKLCCSGNIRQGSVVSDLFIPLQGGNRLPQGKTRRFAYRSDAIDNNDETGAIADQYDEGFRWNTHYYCAPADE